ncbi:hypothetical protein ROA7450_02464 [Roseovarius albus]|uniref:Lipoprotein n=1 Tax=Roseovarius albus TaxID=1247867 RepID=A0A1X6ZF32_9RHOB|nr:hypothetical protein [Roseovarius albus]SLN49936.1 hypothetical protein ROA7450_02464 [Roseovarius albus]
MRIVLVCLAALMMVSACTEKKSRVYFNGIYYPSKAKHASDDRQSFVVTVKRATKGIEGAREAGRVEGTKYCLKNFGTSEINWVQGPDAENGTLNLSGSDLKLTGSCVTW